MDPIQLDPKDGVTLHPGTIKEHLVSIYILCCHHISDVGDGKVSRN
jgi:hypothetical protein